MTSTLQQEASRKLRFSSQTTMRVAQRLYENGYITYMRTDSTTLSESALTAARTQAAQLYGAEFVPAAPRRYERKVKNAQEAHEAIRPAGDSFRTARRRRARALPRRACALRARLEAHRRVADGGRARPDRLASARRDRRRRPRCRVRRLRHRDHVPRLPRRLRGRPRRGRIGEERRRRAAAAATRRWEQQVEATSLEPDGHSTSPPARYTEASLVKALEDRGIGRPSTYASIMGTILDRGYVFKKGTALVPTFLAFSVTKLLEKHFARLVDYEFTASLEDDLDEIAEGKENRVDWLSRFYRGGERRGGPARARHRPSRRDRRARRELDRDPRRRTTSSSASASTARTCSAATSARACPTTWRRTS